MKIICVGMNYAKHNEELNHSLGEIHGVAVPFPASDQAPTSPDLVSSPSNHSLPHARGEGQGRGAAEAAVSSAPTLFLKPETALTRSDWPFFVPDWSNEIEYETELVVRINRLGKSIPERFAHRYYDEITLGIDFTARDVQRQLKSLGLPWEISKGFDGAAYCGQQWLSLKALTQEKYGEEAAQDEHRRIDIQDLHFEMQLNGETRQVGWTGDMLHTVDQIIAYASRFYLLKTGDLIFTGTPAGVGRVQEGDLITAQLEGRQVLECRCK